MKRFTRVLLIVSACMLGIGLLFTGFGIYWSVRVADRYTPEQAVEQTYAVDAAALRRLSVSTGAASLTILPAETPADARIETSGFEQDELTVTQENGLLTIQNDSAFMGASIINLGIFRIDWLGRVHMGTLAPRSISIYLPDAAWEEIRIEGGVGDILSQIPLTADVIHISSGTGRIELAGLTARDLELNGGVGGITLETFSAETLSLSSGTGNMRLSNGRITKQTEIAGGVGRIVLENVEAANASIASGTGTVSLTGALRGACDLTGGVGSIALNLTDRADAYSMRIEKGIGSVSVHNAQAVRDGDDSLYTINADSGAPNSVEVFMGTGSLNITFAE